MFRGPPNDDDLCDDNKAHTFTGERTPKKGEEDDEEGRRSELIG